MGCRFNTVPHDQLNYRGLDTLFDQKSVFQAWLDVEKTVAQAQADLGLIPTTSAHVIIENCEYHKLDLDHLSNGFDKTRHPLMPLINELVRLCGEEHGGYVHWGITTQNVIQTGMLSLTMRAQSTIEKVFQIILGHLSQLAKTHARTIMAGRTHSRHAVPITFGFKVAVWIEELFQAMERLQDCKKRTFVIMMGGAVGCHSALGGDGPKFQKRVAELLGMGQMAIPSRAIRTHICEYANALTLMASVCHRMAEEIYQSSSEEFGEIFEGASDGVIGSSTMPQKINPILCCKIIANGHKIYAQNTLLMSMACRPFESDASTNNIFENGISEIVEIFANILVPTEALLRDLRVDAQRMKKNLDLSNGTIFAELAMMRLGASVGKHKGHSLVHELATASVSENEQFIEALSHLPNGDALQTEIRDVLSGKNGTGLCSTFALHYGALAHDADPLALPSADQRADILNWGETA